MRDAARVALTALLALSFSSCLVLPVRTAPGVEGEVVDAASGAPVGGAIVVVRFDGHSDERLPDRDHLGHAEVETDASGRFRIGRFTRSGVSVWPVYRTEARVVGVMADGYRCPSPVRVDEQAGLRVALQPALDAEDRRASCRPLAARRGEAVAYMNAWRALFPAEETADERDQKRQLSRLLDARAALGFGANCEGPVTDLALEPGGARVAFVASEAGGAAVYMAEFGADRGPVKRVARADDTPARQLAWTGPGELVLWKPSGPEDRAISPSIFAPGSSEVVWTSRRGLPASIDRGTPASSRHTSARQPLDPADLSDEAEVLWLGRSFRLDRELDAGTGLPRDVLRVTREDGSQYDLDLPGEACGGARYGRPQYRIVAGGAIGVDLRFVDGGCHALAIDLASGEYRRLDAVRAPAACRSQRRVPPTQLETALRGWMRELHAAFAAKDADPSAAYALRIAPGAATEVRGRSFAGEPLVFSGPRFPIATPLRRIDVTNIAPVSPGARRFPDTPPAAPAPL